MTDDVFKVKPNSTYQIRQGPSHLAQMQSPATKATLEFFDKLISTAFTRHPTQQQQILQLESKNNRFEVDTIMVRDCYDHLLPHLQHSMTTGETYKDRRIAITGTPGIGKTVYGALLMRHFVREGKFSVVYWERDKIFLFSWNKKLKEKFDLQNFIELENDQTLLYGYWEYGANTSGFSDLLTLPDAIVIHDPKAGFNDVALHADEIERIVFVLSYGHSLIEYWQTKDLGPGTKYFMPLWTEEEATVGAKIWELGLSDNDDEEEGATFSERFFQFGGFIRGWFKPDDMIRSLATKARDVVKENGDSILGRTSDTRGSLVHMHVDFDKKKPKLPFPGSANFDVSQSNKFDKYTYIFGSQRILQMVDQEIMNEGENALKSCMKTWASQPGFESIYGTLFELRFRRLLTQPRDPLEFRMRKVFNGDTQDEQDEEQVYKLTVPPVNIVRFRGHDPVAVLRGRHYAQKRVKGAYFWPWSNNFPTYDAALLVGGDVLYEKGDQNQVIPLLLQMTVSGATGLPCQPKHVVKQHMRDKFDSVFDGVQGMQKGITTFLVPTECFRSFRFQPETRKNDDDQTVLSQPDFQLVLELPDEFNSGVNENMYSQENLLPLSKSPKRHFHRCETRASKRFKMTDQRLDSACN